MSAQAAGQVFGAATAPGAAVVGEMGLLLSTTAEYTTDYHNFI